MLDNGAQLPPITAKDLDGNDVVVGDLLADTWSVALFYRGHW
ncbi:MAG: hypothetical protein OEU32_08700 [Acidimicrobiia bacterium]|nr:hypothetical protein [Acidimicrobiia bacterium]